MLVKLLCNILFRIFVVVSIGREKSTDFTEVTLQHAIVRQATVERTKRSYLSQDGGGAVYVC